MYTESKKKGRME